MHCINNDYPPILMLHHVGDTAEYDSLKPYSISRMSFIRLLNYIERNGYVTTTFVEMSLYNKSLNKHIILTFDDCSKSLFDFAIPELLRRKMKAIFYIPTAHIGLDNIWDINEGRSRLELMNAQDLVFLQNNGMEIGGHSHHHIPLNSISKTELQLEVETCRNYLESILKAPIISFAYPFGVIPHCYAEILANQGFKYGLGIYTKIENSFCISRFIYHDGDTWLSLAFKLSKGYKIYRIIYGLIKNV